LPALFRENPGEPFYPVLPALIFAICKIQAVGMAQDNALGLSGAKIATYGHIFGLINEDTSSRACFNTVSTSSAHVLINSHCAELARSGKRVDRTRLNARGLLTLLANKGNRLRQTLFLNPDHANRRSFGIAFAETIE
jgi:hypothetical protein